MSECITLKAMNECQCESCKEYRKYRQIAIEQIIKWEAYKIWRDSIQNATK